MRVAFISRATVFTGKGGDTVQMLMTASELRCLGVEVDIFPWPRMPDYDSYDIIHAFNVIRPIEVLSHFRRFKGLKVLSTIYVDYSEYEQRGRGKVGRLLYNAGGADGLEYAKTLARWVKNGENNFSWGYLLRGHRRSVRRLLAMCDLLLPNSYSELERLEKQYGVKRPAVVVPNAIDPRLFRRDADITSKQWNLVLCVGRIDGIKNQLALVQALRDTEFEVLLVGDPAPNHHGYYQECLRQAGDNIKFLTGLKQEELVELYSRAKVHILPSWFETTGLSSLEAAAMGCNIVVSERGDVREYFGNHAIYCDPADPSSIFNAVKKASQAPADPALRDKVYAEYVWSRTAQCTLDAYNQFLDRT